MNSIKFEEILQSIQSPVKGNPNLFIVWLIRHLCSCYFCNQIYNLISNYFEGSFLWVCGFLKMFFSICFERFYFERERRVSGIWEKLWWWVSPHCNVRCWIYPACDENISCGPLKSLFINALWSFCWVLILWEFLSWIV